MQRSWEQCVREYCRGWDASARIDRAAAMLREVKILGLHSRNGRRYRPEALIEAVPLYEGARVNVNHPSGDPTAPRDYRDRLGSLENVRYRESQGLFADFRFNPKHALAEQLVWDAENAPGNVGFSHNIQAQLRRDGDQWIVERILKVHAVDLVADPATTQGLFESATKAAVDRAAQEAARSAAALRSAPESAVPASELVSALKSESESVSDQAAAAAGSGEGGSRNAVDRPLSATREAQIAEVLREFHLPGPECPTAWARRLVSREFLEALSAAPDLPTMRAWAADRAALVLAVLARAELPPAERPQCREQLLFGRTAGPIDVRAFVEAITRPQG